MKMAKLVAYAQVGGAALAKAQCEICGKKYADIDEARRCEWSHVAKKGGVGLDVAKLIKGGE